MRVAHRDDYDTHAVIGGKEIQSFEIAQTAEFFGVLSNNIYSNKPLAVVREVLCNAWDSHIVSGRKDVAVKIMIDDDKMTIRDFGNGIPHHLIHQIYCVYGNSTKENDGNQTGGFGLGSKAPFAYSDHFTVSNFHDGIKTVHAISRGSSLTQGKPDRRVIVSVATEETGVEVMIPVKNAIDKANFIKIANDIAAFGEMNVTVNGKLVETVPISKAENNMFLSRITPQGSHGKLNVRYGNVVYPINPDPEYIGAWTELHNLVKAIPNHNRHRQYDDNDYILIMQAEANTISVTPSRESLSNTETTINTIKGLFEGMIKHLRTAGPLFENLLIKEQAKGMENMWAAGWGDKILITKNVMLDNRNTIGDMMTNIKSFDYIHNLSDLANYYLHYKQNMGDVLLGKLNRARVEFLVSKSYRQSWKLKRFLRITKSKRKYYQYEARFYADLMQPLLKKIAKAGLKPNGMQVSIPSSRNLTRHSWPTFETYSRSYMDAEHLLQLMQNTIVVTYSKIAYEDDWNRFMGADMAEKFPKEMHRMVYVASRAKGVKDKAVELFDKLGFNVIDFAGIIEDRKPAPAPKTSVKLAVAKPKVQGLVPLSNMMTDKGNFQRTRHMVESVGRSTTYTHVVKPHLLSGPYGQKFFPWGDDKAADFVRLFGDRIGVVVNDTQKQSQFKKGKGDGIMMLVEEITTKVLTSATIRRHVEISNGNETSRGNLTTLIEMAENSPRIAARINVPKLPSTDDYIYYELFDYMSKTVRSGNPKFNDGTWEKVLFDAYEQVQKWDAAPEYVALNALVKRCETKLRLLNLDQCNMALRQIARAKKEPDLASLVFIETAVINALTLR